MDYAVSHKLIEHEERDFDNSCQTGLAQAELLILSTISGLALIFMSLQVHLLYSIPSIASNFSLFESYTCSYGQLRPVISLLTRLP